jgi:NAD+ diphosphatase
MAFFTNVFAGNPLDRASDRRSDAAWIAAQLDDPAGRAVVFWNGQPLIADDRIAYIPADLAMHLAGTLEQVLFLGLDAGAPVFAIDLDIGADPAAGPLQGRGAFRELRAMADALPLPETGILATARSLFEWRRRHRYCSVCGQPSEVVDGGWKRQCPACNAQHFPRTDPCVIMLPTFGDKCLLGRQASWAPGRYSALAGFVEPGESIEEACAREVREEAGLTVTAVRHHSSQPWPWPSNLMIGLIAEVSDDQAAPSDTELEAVIWLTRQQTRSLLDGQAPGLSAPPELAIARQLIKAWADLQA